MVLFLVLAASAAPLWGDDCVIAPIDDGHMVQCQSHTTTVSDLPLADPREAIDNAITALEAGLPAGIHNTGTQTVQIEGSTTARLVSLQGDASAFVAYGVINSETTTRVANCTIVAASAEAALAGCAPALTSLLTHGAPLGLPEASAQALVARPKLREILPPWEAPQGHTVTENDVGIIQRFGSGVLLVNLAPPQTPASVLVSLRQQQIEKWADPKAKLGAATCGLFGEDQPCLTATSGPLRFVAMSVPLDVGRLIVTCQWHKKEPQTCQGVVTSHPL